MQPGQVVKIYEDPLTEKKLEGEAKLIELLHQDSDREYWIVEFTRGHERHARWIKKKWERPTSEQVGALGPHGSVGVTYPSDLQAKLCERLQYFIEDEEKGIGEYLDYINLMNEAFRHPEPAKVPEHLLRQLLVAVNRIVEEERSHVEMLKKIKERLCSTQAEKSGILPRVKIGKKTYYIDERVGELRNLDNPNDRESIELAYAYRNKWF